MKIIAIIAVYLCSVLMFFVKREYKIAILILSSITFTLVSPPVPHYSAPAVLSLCFLISEIPHLVKLFRQSRKSIVWKITGIALLSIIITILSSPHLSDNNVAYYYFQGEFLCKYLVLIYSFWSFRDVKSLKPTLKVTFWGLIVLTVFGIFNYLSKTAGFVNLMMEGVVSNVIGVSGSDAGNYFTYADRFRVQAMFTNPFDYGYICVLMLILHLYGYTQRLEKLKTFVVVVACTLFGIIFCGCRTILFCTLIGLSIYMLLAFKTQKKLKIILVTLFIIPIAYQTVPAVQEQADKMLSVFDKNSQVEGSSLEMRSIQYATVLFYINDNPWFGRGYGFFNQDLGWGEGIMVDERLEGLEGVVMGLLLEHGIIGLILYLIYYVSIIVYFIRRRKISKHLSALGVSIIAVYLSFANMTGQLLSVFPTLCCVGFVLKALNTEEKELPMAIDNSLELQKHS